MGLITKKDIIRNMASLEEDEPEDIFEVEQEYGVYEAQDSGLLDHEDDGRSNDSD